MKLIHNAHEPPDFSIVLGGPMFQLLLRMGLITPDLGLLNKRIICISLFAWLPLLFFSLADGKAWSGTGMPFLFDFEVQARFLIALPLLIGAEVLVHKRLRLIVGQFIDRNIVTAKELPRFGKLIHATLKWRNSMPVELFLFILVFIGGHYLWPAMYFLKDIASSVGAWYTDSTGTSLSPAGYWSFYVSRPLFQFMAYRWYYRLCIWIVFLWKCSRIDLNLIPTHPDRAGGIGFLSMVSSAFRPLVIAHGVLLAAMIADSIFFSGAHLNEFLLLMLSLVIFIVMIILGPLLVFSAKLMQAKRMGLSEYGVLASEYMREFDQKWIREGGQHRERFMGSSDIQSLADMGNSFQVIREMGPFPFSKDTIIQLIFFTLMPVFPLVLTMIPLEELLRKFFMAIF